MSVGLSKAHVRSANALTGLDLPISNCGRAGRAALGTRVKLSGQGKWQAWRWGFYSRCTSWSRRDKGAAVESHGGYKVREDGQMGKTKVEPTEEPEAGGSV